MYTYIYMLFCSIFHPAAGSSLSPHGQGCHICRIVLSSTVGFGAGNPMLCSFSPSSAGGSHPANQAEQGEEPPAVPLAVLVVKRITLTARRLQSGARPCWLWVSKQVSPAASPVCLGAGKTNIVQAAAGNQCDLPSPQHPLGAAALGFGLLLPCGCRALGVAKHSGFAVVPAPARTDCGFATGIRLVAVTLWLSLSI